MSLLGAAASVRMSAAELNLVVTRGDDFSLPISITSGGVPLDVSGRTYTAKAKNLGAVSAVQMGVDMDSAASGTIVLTMTSLQTSSLRGELKWELEQLSAGRKRTLIFGKIITEGSA